MISVVIPCYNAEKTIARAVQSVLNQTCKDIELIVVDDCSKDGSVSVLEGIRDPRFRFIKMPENGGACKARNAGIREASGEYIAFQDSDDEWHEDKLEKQLAALQAENLDICFCQVRRFRTGRETKVVPDLKGGIIDYDTLIREPQASTQTLLMKREVLDGCLFDERLPRLQDYDLVIRAAQGRVVGLLAEPLVDVYYQSNSITARQYHKNASVYRYLIGKYRDLFAEHPLFQAELYHWYGMYSIKDGNSRVGVPALKTAASRNRKYRLKYMLSRIGVLQIYYRIRKY